MKVSENFTEYDFYCRCGCDKKLNQELLDLMETVRNYWNKPFIVHCTYRCKKHNKKIGGVKNSTHVKAKACDFHIRGIPIKELHEGMLELFTNNVVKNLGLYDWGCHIDIRKFKKRLW